MRNMMKNTGRFAPTIFYIILIILIYMTLVKRLIRQKIINQQLIDSDQ